MGKRNEINKTPNKKPLKARLPPKRGEVKFRIFKLLVEKLVSLCQCVCSPPMADLGEAAIFGRYGLNRIIIGKMESQELKRERRMWATRENGKSRAKESLLPVMASGLIDETAFGRLAAASLPSVKRCTGMRGVEEEEK
ncbi:hypothetical protein CRG98_039281 [Punica granatum]|uniref:Uncharacterized protein n=1 Tax=Punica granatum TaxID=22663 RepID=A0A2I0IAD2_PUNGR|nr:hypothetical protein CRG98_039281 [Punica granatum]